MDELRRRRVAASEVDDYGEPEEAPEPLEVRVADFWTPRESLGTFRVAIKPPTVETALFEAVGRAAVLRASQGVPRCPDPGLRVRH